MAFIVMLVIIFLALMFGAEIGPQVDPTTTTYVPRPDWYFFFLFEVLRVIKPPVFTPFATIAAIAYLTYEGANAGSPNSVDMKPPANLTAAQVQTFNAGKLVVGQSGCLACHVIGDNGNNGPGPPLTHIGSKLRPDAIAQTLRNPTAPMPSFRGLAAQYPQKFQDLVNFLAELQ